MSSEKDSERPPATSWDAVLREMEQVSAEERTSEAFGTWMRSSLAAIAQADEASAPRLPAPSAARDRGDRPGFDPGKLEGAPPGILQQDLAPWLDQLARTDDAEAIRAMAHTLGLQLRGTGDRVVVEGLLAAGLRVPQTARDGTVLRAAARVGGLREDEWRPLLAAWMEDSLVKMQVQWWCEGRTPSDVKDVLARHGVPVLASAPPESWPPIPIDMLRCLMGRRVGARTAEDQEMFDWLLAGIREAFPADEELEEQVDDAEAEDALDVDGINAYLRDIGAADRLIELDEEGAYVVLAPPEPFYLAASDLGIPVGLYPE